MIIRFLLDLALVTSLALEPNSGAAGTMAPDLSLDAPRGARRGVVSGPRPPKRPPEKRAHDSSWSEIKSLIGRRP